MNPEIFIKHPWSSVLQNGESENIARNVMVILYRTGNIFRPLTWDEYKTERLKDGNFGEIEKLYFDKIIDYCKNEDTAKLFSPTWRKAYEENEQFPLQDHISNLTKTIS